jgi:tetratricopeptide (TPR) repeat protein
VPQDFRSAEAAFVEAFELEPGFVPGHLGLGLCFLVQGRLDEAIVEFRTGLPPSPQTALLISALSKLAHHDEEGALAEVRRLEQAGSATFHFALATYHARFGSREDAFIWLRKAAEFRLELTRFSNIFAQNPSSLSC